MLTPRISAVGTVHTNISIAAHLLRFRSAVRAPKARRASPTAFFSCHSLRGAGNCDLIRRQKRVGLPRDIVFEISSWHLPGPRKKLSPRHVSHA